MVGVRQFDEQEMIATALDVFWRKGLHDATMQDLAAATGVQRGSLYNAYGDKEAIFLRAFDQYAEQFLDASARALAEGDAATRLKTFFDMIIVNMTSGTPQRGCLTTRENIMAMASNAEAGGFAIIGVADHLIVPVHTDVRYPYTADGIWPGAPTAECFDAIATLTFLAGFTVGGERSVDETWVPLRHILIFKL